MLYSAQRETTDSTPMETDNKATLPKERGKGTLNSSQPQQIPQNMLHSTQKETTGSTLMETANKTTLPKEPIAALLHQKPQQWLRTGNSKKGQNLFNRTSYTAVAKSIKNLKTNKKRPYSKTNNSKPYKENNPDETGKKRNNNTTHGVKSAK
jgi:hypothetical protein